MDILSPPHSVASELPPIGGASALPSLIRPGVVTLLLQGKSHAPEEDESIEKFRTLHILEGEVVEDGTMLQRPANCEASRGSPRVLTVALPAFLPSPRHSPRVVLDPASARRRGVRQLPLLTQASKQYSRRDKVQQSAPSASSKAARVGQLPSVRNPRQDALWSLSALITAFREGADCSQLLRVYYKSLVPNQGGVLSEWLLAQKENPLVWSQMHHKIRWRSRRRHFSLLRFADDTTPLVRQTGSLLIYVKAWMDEFDNQDAPTYRSSWLRVRSNRGNFARFCGKAANCTLMASYLDEILTVPKGDLMAQAGRAFSRVDKAVEQARNGNVLFDPVDL